jgi:hypothetical protein
LGVGFYGGSQGSREPSPRLQIKNGELKSS